jgi:hypothetical protein
MSSYPSSLSELDYEPFRVLGLELPLRKALTRFAVV